MLKMVDGTGIIGVDMVCPLGGAVSPPQPPNYDKVEMEGVRSLMLPNSLKAPIERLELIGNSVQLTTTGKNLLNIPFIDGSVRETPIQCNFEKRILIHAEILPKSIQSNVWRIKVVYKDNTLKYVVDSDMQKGSLFDASPENPIVSINYRGLYITEGRYEKIQVEHGVKVTPYEPYTGGKPSPSPEYPQEIKNVGKWNEGTQKYEIDVKVTNSEQGWTEEQTLTLTSDFPITKWDKLVEQGGQYGWLYASKKYVITGNEFFEPRSGYDQDAYTNRFIVVNDLFVNRLNDKQLAYCKILKRVQYIYAQNKLEEGIDTNINQLHIKLSNDRIGVLSSDDTETRTAKIAEYIKNTYTDGIEIMYMSSNSVFVPLPQSEQTQLRNLHSYNGTTHVFVDSGEVPCGIKLTYRKEK